MVPIMGLKDSGILLVEDDSNDILFIQRAFRNSKLENSMQVVRDGDEAVAYLSGEGKYADRKEASISDLMTLRVALAPLSSRAGVETVKSIRLTTVGASLRLNASKLVGTFLPGSREILQQMRVLGVVTTDGPTRVLRFW